MSNPLGNPSDAANITVTDAVTTITVAQGLSSLEIQNSGDNNVAFGKASTLTFARGILLYRQGDRKSWENLTSGWTVSFRCDTGKTTTLKRVDYV
jgi:hypothetical protein